MNPGENMNNKRFNAQSFYDRLDKLSKESPQDTQPMCYDTCGIGPISEQWSQILQRIAWEEEMEYDNE